MNPLVHRLREHIQHFGPMPFTEFMRRALYDSSDGYYSRDTRKIGKRGDFMTSVSVGAFFGELLAFQFARWIELLRNQATSYQIVEAGAHDGQLARDILESLHENEPSLLTSIEYWIIEPHAGRRVGQQKTLAPFFNVRWFKTLDEIQGRVNGIIFSNELLDALPAHPFSWNAAARRFEEIGVGLMGDSFVWTRLPQPTIAPPQFPPELLDVLPDDYVFELSPDASEWWKGAASALTRGFLLTIDYGGVLEELLSPSRTSGTMRAYSRHRVTADVLANPGEQDITTHVNFSEIQRAGEAAGLKTVTLTTQSQFLTEIARALWTRRGSWPQHQVRQFQTLTHPEHLGRPFRVLVQSR